MTKHHWRFLLLCVVQAFFLLPAYCAFQLGRATRSSIHEVRRFSSHIPLKLASVVPESSSASSSSSVSDASEWHRERRRQMMQKYGDQIAPLERASSQTVGLPLLSFVNISLLCLSVGSGTLPVPAVVALAVFPGSVLSLWQLQLLHDVVHGSFFDKGSGSVWGVSRKEAQERLLFWGSMPSIFGYYLYLKYGHLSHHKNLGDPEKATLEQLFDSAQADFEDGDVLFVAHRMKLKGNIGPKIPLPGGKELKLSISDSGFQQWREGNASWNAAVFAASFLFERYAVAFNDIFVAATGRNFYFPNKPESFHNDCASYARWALLVRGSLLATVGWKALLFLFLSETLWSIPPHPACAMFVTNHGSHMNEDGQCVPTSSTYAGRWYEYFTLNTGRSGN